MSNTVDNYLFLGLPASGKTTYFSVMARMMQHRANNTEGMRFLFMPSDNGEEMTSDFIQDCILRLIKDQRWVMKTQDYSTAYRFRLELEKDGLLGLWKTTHTHLINYHDYPGEAFEVAFGIVEKTTPEMKKIAEKMVEEVQRAKGIFLIVDAELFFNGERDREFRTTLEKMFWLILTTNPYAKMAIVFNKLELFLPEEYTEQQLREKMQEDYPNAYSRLPKEHKFFTVYPLGEVETTEKGEIIPPKKKKLSPRQIFEPIEWMLDLPQESSSRFWEYVCALFRFPIGESSKETV